MASRISSIILNNPVAFLDSFVSMMGFKFLESSIKFANGKSVKMANNFTALFHAIGVLASALSPVVFGYIIDWGFGIGMGD